MEQSLAEQAAASSAQIFSPSNSFSFGGRSTGLTVSLPSASVTLSSRFPRVPYSPPASFSPLAGVLYSPSTSLSRDPPAAGPSVAAMASTTRLRAAVLNAAAANAAARRTTRSRGPSTTTATTITSTAEEDPNMPPRRSTRKRAPPAVAATVPRDPPAKKPKRGNLKSPPPGSEEDDRKPEPTIASCCICMDEPKPADLASISGCDHYFCFECIEKWAERENTCPLCKVRFTKIDRVNKTRKKKGEASSKNTKRVKQKDQRSDLAPGAALEGLLASFSATAHFPPHRVARLIFSGMGGAAGGSPFAALPVSSMLQRNRAAAANSVLERAMEDSLFGSDTDDDDDSSFLPMGPAFADLFRRGGGPGGILGRSVFDPPPTGRSYASNSNDRNAGRDAVNPLEIEDDSDDEEVVEVVQVTRPV